MFNQTRLSPTRLAIVALFLLLPVLAYPELIFQQRTLYRTDLSWIHYPRHIFAAAEWLAGRIPLWDPYQHNGMPILADSQVGVLYPFSLLFLSPAAPSLELTAFILLHYSLAALFTFMLAKTLGLADAAATVAGLTFGMGGVLMAQVTNLNIMTGAVWLPLILWAVIQATRTRRWSVALLAGLPLALQIFTAQPQVVFYSISAMLGYGLYRAVADAVQPAARKRWQTAAHTLLLAAAAVVAGLLLSAPQWLATLELQQLSVRSAERGLEFLTKNSLPPALLLNLLLPGAFGNTVTGFAAGDPFQEDFIYLGFIPLLLVFFSLPQRRQRDFPFFALLAVAGLLLALGGNTPLYQAVVQHLPGFSLFRIPARWLMVLNLGLAILAAYGMQTLLTGGLSRRQGMTALAGGTAVLLLVGASWAMRDALNGWAGLHWDGSRQQLLAGYFEHSFAPNPAYAGLLWPPLLRVPTVLLALNITLTLALFATYALQKISPQTFGWLAVALLSLDLALAGGTTINPTQPAEWWQQRSGGADYVLQNLAQGRVFPVGMGSEEAAVSQLGQYFPSVYRVRSAGGHGSSLMLARTLTFLTEAHPVQAVQTLGVRYLLTEGYMGADAAATFPIVFADDRSLVHENPTPLPRAYMVQQAVVANSAAEALAYFTDTALNPATTVVLEGAPPPLPAGSTAPPASVNIRHETPQHIQIEVSSQSDGYLVLLDTFYPGWRATLNGQPAEIYRANYVSRAVYVPAGSYTVEFMYQPQPFWLGVGLAGITLAIIAGLLLVRKHRPAAPDIQPPANAENS